MTSPWHPLRLSTLLLAVLVVWACKNSEPGAPLPPVNEELSLEMAEGQYLKFDVELSTREILRLRADQRDLDVVLSVESYDGLSREFDSGNAFNGPEWLIYQAQTAGRHRVEVEAAAASYPGESTGISLTVESRGEASSEDLVLLRAYDAMRSISALDATTDQIIELGSLMESPPETLPGLVRARVAYLLGRIHRFAGRPMKAARFLREATEGFQSFGNAWEETTALNHLGFVLLQIGELDEAENVLTRADELSHQTNQPRTRAGTWSNLGILNAARGHHSEALRHYRRSEELFEAVDDQVGMAYCRNNIGVQLLFLGEIEAGLRSLQEAVDLWQALDRPLDLGTTLVSLAWGFSLLSEMTDRPAELEKAIVLTEEAIAIFETEGSRWDLGVALEQRGWYRLQLGKPKLTLEDLNQAADLAENSNEPKLSSWIGLGLGASLAQLGQAGEARSHLEQSLLDFEEQGHHTGQVETYLALARLERSVGDRERAAALLEQAVEVAEGPRLRLHSDQFRRSYLATHQDVYQELVDLWAEASWNERTSESADPIRARLFAERALAASEMGRARVLLDRLNNSARLWAAAEPGEELRTALNSLEAQTILPSRPPDRTASGREGASPTEAGIDALADARLKWWQALETGRSIPSGASGVSLAPNVESIYRQLDEETSFVVYSLGQRRSWAFLVTAESIHVVPLAARREIESAARRVQELLPRWDTPGSRTAARESLSSLSELVWRPLEDLTITQRVGVVAAGALLGVPISVLPDSRGNPLAGSRSFVYLPSLSILEYLRRQRLSQLQVTSESLFTIIADPVFELDDPRISAQSRLSDSRPTRASLPRLPGTSREARHLEELLAGLPDGPQTRILEGFQADADLFRNETIENSRFLHIATHGIVDDRDPALAGLVFSLYDSRGQPRDGFLPVRDLYRTDLAAELVVLSACRTGKGQPIRGEGLVGFSHAFFAGGAKHLLVSLWDVDDEATAELMERYYSYLFDERLGPVRALRMAQEEMRRHPRWSSPSHWAGFVAWGDWELQI